MREPLHTWMRRGAALFDSPPAEVAPRSFGAAAENLTAVTTNYTNAPLGDYTHGLTGVQQVANEIFYNALTISFLSLMVLVLVVRWWRMGMAHLRHTAVLANTSKQKYWERNHYTWWPWFKKHVLFAPLWRVRHNREFQLSEVITLGTLPSRFHTCVLVAYWASNIAYCLILPYDRHETEAIVAALRGRSGSLAALNLIPAVLFALRNNPLIPLLRVSYDTFNLLHRWCARMVIVLAVVHTAAWASNTRAAYDWGGFADALSTVPSYQWGMVGTACFMFLLVQTLPFVRHAFYETFLNIHRIVVIFALVGLYLHLHLHKLPQLPWVQLVCVIWGWEYICRFSRIIYYNISKRAVTRITATALPGEATRVTFKLVRPWKPNPGCHVHMYIPQLASWSSHPFSVAWTDNESSIPASYSHDEAKLPTSNRDIDLDRIGDSCTHLSLICRVRTGMTRKLYEAARANGGTLNTWGLVEGPYGGHESLDSYGTVVLFAGGVGITHQIGYVKHLIEGYHSGTTATRKILLVWTIPNTDCLDWIRDWMDAILVMKGRRECFRMLIFISKPRSPIEVRNPGNTVQVIPGRCNAQTVLDKEVMERVGAMAVTVCGPGPFSDAVRAAARKRVGVGVVDFIEEAFTY